jgi:hypothetical protein
MEKDFLFQHASLKVELHTICRPGFVMGKIAAVILNVSKCEN